MSLSHALNNNIKKSLYIQLNNINIDNLYKNILNNKKNKNLCDCDINSCYCISYGINYNLNKNNNSDSDSDNIILEKKYPKKITKNQSNKNYNYLFNQWV